MLLYQSFKRDKRTKRYVTRLRGYYVNDLIICQRRQNRRQESGRLVSRLGKLALAMEKIYLEHVKISWVPNSEKKDDYDGQPSELMVRTPIKDFDPDVFRTRVEPIWTEYFYLACKKLGYNKKATRDLFAEFGFSSYDNNSNWNDLLQNLHERMYYYSDRIMLNRLMRLHICYYNMTILYDNLSED